MGPRPRAWPARPWAPPPRPPSPLEGHGRRVGRRGWCFFFLRRSRGGRRGVFSSRSRCWGGRGRRWWWGGWMSTCCRGGGRRVLGEGGGGGRRRRGGGTIVLVGRSCCCGLGSLSSRACWRGWVPVRVGLGGCGEPWLGCGCIAIRSSLRAADLPRKIRLSTRLFQLPWPWSLCPGRAWWVAPCPAAEEKGEGTGSVHPGQRPRGLPPLSSQASPLSWVAMG